MTATKPDMTVRMTYPILLRSRALLSKMMSVLVKRLNERTTLIWVISNDANHPALPYSPKIEAATLPKGMSFDIRITKNYPGRGHYIQYSWSDDSDFVSHSLKRAHGIAKAHNCIQAMDDVLRYVDYISSFYIRNNLSILFYAKEVAS